MQLGARYRAVFEILQEVFKDKNPADNIVVSYLRERKYIGSKDRRFIVEKVWDLIRHRRRLAFEAGGLDIRKMLLIYLKDEDLDLIFGADAYALPEVSKEEKLWLKALDDSVVYPADVEVECPKWLFDKVNDLALLKSLNSPARADMRINSGDREKTLVKLRKEGLFLRPTPYSPIGICSDERVNLNNCVVYQNGEIDVQDESSQLAAILCNPQPNLKIIDYCAGAGGKTFTLLYLMHGKGKIFVHDAYQSRLSAMKERGLRLGYSNYEIISDLGNQEYDLFVVDAPCSGTGTWRRAPDAKYRLTPEALDNLVLTQAEILETAYQHTAKGGQMVYMTCSVLADENQNQIQAFLKKHGDVKPVDLSMLWQEKIGGRYPFFSVQCAQFSPLVTQTDGFFVCVLQKF